MDVRFNEISALNRALKSSNPIIAAESLADSIRNNDAKPGDGSVRNRSPSDLLGFQNKGHLFLLFGQSHYHGDAEGRKDFIRAARYLHGAYKEGCTAAALCLGNLFYYGNGVKLNYGTAFRYY